MSLNVNAKPFNVNAKSFVPGGGAVLDTPTAAVNPVPSPTNVEGQTTTVSTGAPSVGSVHSQPFIPAANRVASPQEAMNFRYILRKEGVKLPPRQKQQMTSFSLSQLLSEGTLKPVQSAMGPASLDGFLSRFFTELQEKPSLNNGFLLLRNAISTADISSNTTNTIAENANGLLVPLLLPSQSLVDVGTTLYNAFLPLSTNYQSDSRFLGMGYLFQQCNLQQSSNVDVGIDNVSYFHYFYLVVSRTITESNFGIVEREILQEVQGARSVFWVPTVLPHVLRQRQFVGAFFLTDDDRSSEVATAKTEEGTGESSNSEKEKKEEEAEKLKSKIKPAVPVLKEIENFFKSEDPTRVMPHEYVEIRQCPESYQDFAKFQNQLLQTCWSTANNQKSNAAVVSENTEIKQKEEKTAEEKENEEEKKEGETTKNGSNPQNQNDNKGAGSLYLSNVIVVLRVALPKEGRHATDLDVRGSCDYFSLLIKLLCDVLIFPTAIIVSEKVRQEFVSKFRQEGTESLPVGWHAITPVLRSLYTMPVSKLLSEEQLSIHAKTQLVPCGPNSSSQLLQVSNAGTPFAATCFTPVTEYETYLSVLALIDAAGERKQSVAANIRRFNRGSYNTAATRVAKSNYRLRRSVQGVKVLLVIDSVRNLYLVDAETKGHVVALPSWMGPQSPLTPLCWSGTLNGASCVLEGTLSHCFRGMEQFRVFIHDVLLWNHQRVGTGTLLSRLNLLDNSSLDEDDSWCYASPCGITILRSSYTTVDGGSQFLNLHSSETPNIGLVFVPVTDASTNPQAITHPSTISRVPFCIYEWSPPETVTALFALQNIRDLPLNLPYAVCSADLCCIQDTEGGEQAAAVLESFNNEYVDFLKDSFPVMKDGVLVECMLRREPDGAHWWEILKDFQTSDRMLPNSKDVVDSLVNDPMVTAEEISFTFCAQNFLCAECDTVHIDGREDQSNARYYCLRCWEKYGFGDCAHCQTVFVAGRLDAVTTDFYCNKCWAIFQSQPSTPLNGENTPLSAHHARSQLAVTSPLKDKRVLPIFRDYMTIVQTHLVQQVSALSHHETVLHLCCGDGVDLRKFARADIQTYVGIDVKAMQLREAEERKKRVLLQLQDAETSSSSTATSIIPTFSAATGKDEETSETATSNNLENNSNVYPRFDFICADCFSPEFWTTHLTKTCARSQFNLVCCLQGLHRVFKSLQDANAILKGISRAVVPNGCFFGSFVDIGIAKQYVSRSETGRYTNEVFRVEVRKKDVTAPPTKSSTVSSGPTTTSEQSTSASSGDHHLDATMNENEELQLSVYNYTDMDECAISPKHLMDLADQHGFRVEAKYSLSWPQFFEKFCRGDLESSAPDFSHLSSEELELLALYRTFVFVKKASVSPLLTPKTAPNTVPTPAAI